jgi:LacI family transcriptional regulator
VEDEARQAGYALSVVSTAPGGGREIQDAVDSLVSQGVEAIIISEPQDFGDGMIDVPDGIEVLTFNSRPVTSSSREFLAATDEAAGARAATRHLMASAPIVDHISGPLDWLASRTRLRGWQDALEEAGIEPPDAVQGDWSPRSGVEAMRTLLARGTRAVFIANDQMAVGAMSAIHEAGLRTGIDVALVGFDDLDVAEFLTPPLSSVQRDFRAVSRVGMHELLARLDGAAPGPPPDPLPSRLIVRASSASL